MTDSPRGPSDHSHDELIQSYLDRETSPEAEAAFRQLLSEPAFRRRLADYAIDNGQLYELSMQGMLGAVPSHAAPVPKPHRNWYRWAGFMAAVSLVIAVGATLWVVQPRDLAQYDNWAQRDDRLAIGRQEPPAIGQIVGVSGKVAIDFDGAKHTANANDAIRSGEVIRTIGLSSSVLLQLDDGSQLALPSDTQIAISRVDRQTQVVVHDGQLSANVSPQPVSSPMLIVTATAEMLVLGTTLTVSADAQRSELAVGTGRVRLKRLSDGSSVEVSAGQYCVASPQTELSVRPLPPAPATWSVDFNSGLPSGWQRGQWINEGLPDDRTGAVLAVRRSEGGRPAYNHYVISSMRDWTQGLFRIENDSVLHVRYAMSRPGWFQIMMSARSSSTFVKPESNYQFKELDWRGLEPNQWQTASVPLSAFSFSRPGLGAEFAGKRLPPRAGDVVYGLWFDTGEKDCGLVIDRIWVDEKKD